MEKVKEKEVTVVKDEVTMAQELLQKKEGELRLAFQEEYNELCKKHGFSLMPSITIKGDGSVIPSMDIILG